jgi:hypothetical protein
MDTFNKATDERYRAMLDSEGDNNGAGSAISRRTGVEILMDLLATLPYEDLCRYLLTPAQPRATRTPDSEALRKS